MSESTPSGLKTDVNATTASNIVNAACYHVICIPRGRVVNFNVTEAFFGEMMVRQSPPMII